MPKAVLDTNIFLYAIQRKVQSLDSLDAITNLPQVQNWIYLTPWVVIAELRYFVIKRNWGEEKKKILNYFISKLQNISPNEETIENYARLKLFAERKGKAMQANDLWIAATACAAQAVLVTNDNDFEILKSYPDFQLLLLKDLQ